MLVQRQRVRYDERSSVFKESNVTRTLQVLQEYKPEPKMRIYHILEDVRSVTSVEKIKKMQNDPLIRPFNRT